MRYVDVGTLHHSPVKQSPRHSRKKPSLLGRFVKATLGFVALGVLVFGIYSYLPPIKDSIASVFNGSSAAFSWIVTGGKELKQSGGKTNVLLLGIDKRADEPYSVVSRNGAESKSCFRTDTMIVASYNYDTKKVTMLSLPRDMWVKIEGFGNFATQSTKINAAYCFGDMYKYPGGGMALATKIISQYLGVPIHYSARVDFEGFRQAIDAVGGVDVMVDKGFVDYEYPIEGRENALPVSSRYKVVRFKAGLQHMDAQTALEYARSRHGNNGEGTDFARSQRQEKVIQAFRDKIFSTDSLKNPAALTRIYSSLGESFATNLQADELGSAYTIAQNIDSSGIATYSLDDRSEPGGLLYAPPMAQYGGAYVLVPKSGSWTDIREFVRQIFSDEGYIDPDATPTPTGLE
jgi:LCP family protein required for cell wall assembly